MNLWNRIVAWLKGSSVGSSIASTEKKENASIQSTATMIPIVPAVPTAQIIPVYGINEGPGVDGKTPAKKARKAKDPNAPAKVRAPRKSKKINPESP